MIIFKYRATASTRTRLLPELLNIIDLQIGDDRIEVLRNRNLNSCIKFWFLSTGTGF